MEERIFKDLKFIKKGGSLMLELIFSLGLVGLVAVSLLSNFYNMTRANGVLNDRNNLINYGNSQMEEVIAGVYRGEGVKNPGDFENYLSSIENQKSDGLNHIILKVKDLRNEKEIELEVYLKEEGIFTNWNSFSPKPCRNINNSYGILILFGRKIPFKKLFR